MAERRQARDLVIVSRERSELYDLLRRSPSPNVEVRLDQRLGERRTQFAPAPRQRRRRDRRRLNVSNELRRVGWALVPAGERSPDADMA